MLELDPPYTAVIFTSVRTDGDHGYAAMDAAMDALSRQQPGYLGIESILDPTTGEQVTISYWRDEADALAWKAVSEHRVAQGLGRERWYRDYRVRVATVHREYGPDGG